MRGKITRGDSTDGRRRLTLPREIFVGMDADETSYRVTVRGNVSDRLASAFDGVTVERGASTTVLVCNLRDQSELYGLLNRLRDFGLDLVGLAEVG